MSFKDELPDEATKGLIFSLGLMIFIGIVMVNAAGKFKKDRDNSVVVRAGEIRK